MGYLHEYLLSLACQKLTEKLIVGYLHNGVVLSNMLLTGDQHFTLKKRMSSQQDRPSFLLHPKRNPAVSFGDVVECAFGMLDVILLKYLRSLHLVVFKGRDLKKMTPAKVNFQDFGCGDSQANP